jgi:hypothetical protein
MDYRLTYLPSLKRSTRRGYESVLDIHLVPHFGGLPVIDVSAQAASTLDLKLAKTPGVKAGTTKAKNTRNNIQIVLHSVLRFGSKHGYLTEVPGALPQFTVECLDVCVHGQDRNTVPAEEARQHRHREVRSGRIAGGRIEDRRWADRGARCRRESFRKGRTSRAGAVA